MRNRRSSNSTLLVVAFFAFLLGNLLLVVLFNLPMFVATWQGFGRWLQAPHLMFGFIDLSGWPAALFTYGAIWVIGTLAAHRVTPREMPDGLKRISALALGFGAVGLGAMVLAIFNQLAPLPLNLVLVALLTVAFPLREGVAGVRVAFQMWRPRKLEQGDRLLILFCVPLLIVIIYQGLALPEIEWDALIYHAVLPRLIFEGHGFPALAGPSTGIQISANYPPLFPVLGALFYTQIGVFNETWLRVLSLALGILPILATFELGVQLGSRRVAQVSVALLAITPMFLYRMMIASYYSILVFFAMTVCTLIVYAYRTCAVRTWIAIGAILGFALLCAFQAVVYAACVALICIAILIFDKSARQTQSRYMLSGLIIAGLIIGVWWSRNIVVVGNPIYPVASGLFGGLNLDPELTANTLTSLHDASIGLFFGLERPTPASWALAMFFNRLIFPTFSIFPFVGLLCIPKAKRGVWLLVILFHSGIVFGILSAALNIFPRYFYLFLPLGALLMGLLFDRILQIKIVPGRTMRQIAPLRRLRFSAIALIVPTTLVLAGGRATVENPVIIFSRFTLPLEYEQANYESVVADSYRDLPAWRWLVQNIHPNERIGLYEYRIYSLLNAKNRDFFYFDGAESKPIRKAWTVTDALRALNNAQVTYLLDNRSLRVYYWEGKTFIMPFNASLGMSDLFPVIYQVGVDAGYSRIIHVGPDPSLNPPDGEPLLNYGASSWQPTQTLEGKPARQSIPGGEPASVFIRRSGANLVVEIEYLDRGIGSVEVRLQEPDTFTGLQIRQITLTNTGEWRIVRFALPNTTNVLSHELPQMLSFASETTAIIISRIHITPTLDIF